MTERLSGLDSMFVAADSPAAHLHVLGVAVVEPIPGVAPIDAAGLRRLLASRLDDLAPLRRKLRRGLLDLEDPSWVDAEVDLDTHVHEARLPAPGGADELSAFVATTAAIGLDLTRPLWEMWCVDGLVAGRHALVAKIHHSVIDGVAAVGLMARLFDLEPVAPPSEAAFGVPRDSDGSGEPEAVVTYLPGVTTRPPGPAGHVPAPAAERDLAAHALDAVSALTSLLRRPARLADAAGALVRAGERLVPTLRGHEEQPATPFLAPRLSMNGSLAGERRIATASIDRGFVDATRATLGATVNDVVLAVLAGGLHRYLVRRGELPDRPLVAAVPTSLRAGGEEDRGNRVSVLFAHLPVHLDDPQDRLRSVVRTAARGKAVYEAVGGDTLPRVASLAPPLLVESALHLVTRLHLADVLPPPVNLVVSNVPGPTIPLFLGGSRVRDAYAYGPVVEGVGLNVTVLSYLDRVGFGLLADARRVPDLDDLAADVETAAVELQRAVGAPVVPPAPATGAAGVPPPRP